MKLLTRKAASIGALTILGLTAGGIAWAESTSAPITSSVSAGVDAGAAAMAGHGVHRMHGFGRHVLHGEVVMQTRNGFVTAVIARGMVTAIDAGSISVKSADGVTTTFAMDAKTKARSAGKAVALTAVHQGDQVGVLGVKHGTAVPMAKLIRERPAAKNTT